MQCNRPGCKDAFHVTCAQAAGLLCEEVRGDHSQITLFLIDIIPGRQLHGQCEILWLL